MTKCQQAGCPNSGPERIYTRGDYQQPLGPWCDSCWAIIEERSHELMGTFDELKPTIGPKGEHFGWTPVSTSAGGG